MTKLRIGNGRLAQGVPAMAQLQSVSHQMPSSQSTTDTDRAAVTSQAGLGEFHHLIAVIQRGLGDGHGSDPVGGATAVVHQDHGVTNQTTDARLSPNASEESRRLSQGTEDTQHDAGAESDAITQHNDRIQDSTGTNVAHGADTQRTSIFGNGIGIQNSTPIRHGTSILSNNGVYGGGIGIIDTGDDTLTLTGGNGSDGATRSRNGGGDFVIPQIGPTTMIDPENTCLWITKLPADCTLDDLCTALAGCGKIVSMSILPAGPFYEHAAANVTFWDLQGVDQLVEKVKRGKFVVQGQAPTVASNRFAGRSREASHKSRVVMVGGPVSVVDQSYLEAVVFKFAYELQGVVTAVDYGWWRCLEYRLSSLGEAEDMVEAVLRFGERTDIFPMVLEDWKEVKVSFGVDPCEKKKYDY